MRLLSILLGFIAGFFVLGMIGMLMSGEFQFGSLIVALLFVAAFWSAHKKVNDPARLEKIRTKKAEKAAKRKQGQERWETECTEWAQAERTAEAEKRAARDAEKAAKKAQRKAEAEEWMRKSAELAEISRLERERIKRERIRDNTPVAAVVISSQDKTKTTGGLGSAMFGGMIAGPVGAVVGASVGKKKTQVTGQRVTFSVKYESGRTGVETVDVTSKRFRELSALLVK